MKQGLRVGVAEGQEGAAGLDEPGQDLLGRGDPLLDVVRGDQAAGAGTDERAEDHVVVAGRVLAVDTGGVELTIDDDPDAFGGDRLAGGEERFDAEAAAGGELAERLVEPVVVVGLEKAVAGEQLEVKDETAQGEIDDVVAVAGVAADDVEEVGEAIGALTDRHVVPDGGVESGVEFGGLGSDRERGRLEPIKPFVGESPGGSEVALVGKEGVTGEEVGDGVPGVDVKGEGAVVGEPVDRAGERGDGKAAQLVALCQPLIEHGAKGFGLKSWAGFEVLVRQEGQVSPSQTKRG